MANIQAISAEEIAREASDAGIKAITEFKKTTLNSYITRFLAHKANLEKIRVDRTTPAGQESIEKRLSVLSQLTTIQTYASSKGGGDVLPEEELKKVQQIYNDRHSAIHKWAAKAYSDKSIKRISLQIMRDVYNLRQSITGRTEKFALIYRGERNVITTTEVDISTFFQKLLNNLKSLELHTSENIMDYGLRFNNSTMRGLLKQGKFGEGTNMTLEGYDQNSLASFYRTQRDTLTTVEKTFKELNKTELRWVGLDEKGTVIGQQKQGDKENNITGVLRNENGKYFIVEKKYASGFIAQEIFNAYKNKTPYEYKTDKVDWFLGGDVEHGNMDYSVKSFLEGAPSLVSINSLFTVVNKILSVLLSQQDQPIETIQEQLKSYVFSSSKVIADTANKEINDLFKILTG